jgi:hypothetical protein
VVLTVLSVLYFDARIRSSASAAALSAGRRTRGRVYTQTINGVGGRRDLATDSELLHRDLTAPVTSRAAEAAASGSTRESPLILGVLGHSELEMQRMPRLRDALMAFVSEIEHHLPDTELRVIVGVTGGGDLLFVRAALERGLQVEIVLPEALHEFTAGLDAEGRAALQGLLQHANVRCTHLSVCGGPGDHAKSGGELYTALTETLVRRSSILLTPWGGNAPARTGIRDAALRHIGIRADDHASEVSLVMLGLADDVDAADSVVSWTPAAPDGVGAAAAAAPAPRMPSQLARQLVDLNTYNRDFRHLRTRRPDAPVGSLLTGVPSEMPLEEWQGLEAVDAEYAKADALALHYQSRADRLFALFVAMAFTMGLAYLVYDKLAHRSALLVSYLVVLICSLGLYYALRGERWFAKHLTYRALAETLRVTFYLRLAGIDQRLDAGRVLALSGINRFRGFSLITHVLAALAVPGAQAGERCTPSLERSRCMEQEWIEGQFRYFTAKVAKLKRKGRRVKVLKNALFATIVVGMFAMILSQRLMEGYTVNGVSLHNGVTFVEGVLALLLAAWQLHDTNKATRELLLQYRNQGSHFARARRQLAALTDLAEREHILLELGRDSLMESYMWTIHRYHREHEPGRH